MDSILNFQEKYIESDVIKSYEYNEYQPTSGSNFNISGNINIHIENKDEFYHPSRSYLLVEGDLLKEVGTRYAAADVISLANNGVMHLFSNVKYELAGQEIKADGRSISFKNPIPTARSVLQSSWRILRRL